MYVKDVLIVLTQILVMAMSAEELNGRHVCSHQQVIADPVPVQQSYIRAIHRKDIQKTVYQTAYKTVFKMQIRYANVSGCCPGWEKRTPRDTNCMQPICEEDCENGGQCVGPDLCVCGEGYTGYRCHMDIDECSGRNSCQQKCTNLPGSYQCSCQDGFQLAEDDYTCDLCLSCADEFKELSVLVDRLQVNNNLDDVVDEIREMMNNLTFEATQTNALADIQRELANLTEVVVQVGRFDNLQQEVNALKDSTINVEIVKELNSRIDGLQESTLQSEKFKELEAKIDDMASVEDVAEIAQSLNDTIKNLRDEVSQTKHLDEVQKQIEEMAAMKAQQDEAQADRFQEMHKELEQLREEKELSQTLKVMEELLAEVSGRLRDLESHQHDHETNSSLQNDELQKLQRELEVLKDSVKRNDNNRDIISRLDNLEASSAHENKFNQEIQNKLVTLASIQDVTEVAQSLNETIQSWRQDDSRSHQLKGMQKQIAELESARENQEETQADMFEELHKQLGELQQIKSLSREVQAMKEQMDHLASRVRELETEKSALRTNLTQVLSQYEAAASAFHAKEVNIEHITTDPYESESDPKISDDRLMSLSAQISILEEKMADCQCGQDYSRG